ncbi:MAG: hypothetical protein Q9173_003242, partial [Seirophora scorigena]
SDPFGSAKPQDGAIASQSRWIKLWIPSLAKIVVTEYTIELGPSEGKHTTNNTFLKSESKPKLREEVKEDVKNETNKDGSGKGQMTAWKISKEYEKKGGSYENEAGSENKPTKGAPEPKSDEQKDDETKDASDDKPDDKEKEKPKANSGKKATGKKGESRAKAPKKEKKAPTEGTRKSSRIGGKRSAPEEEKQTEDKVPAKKAKSGKK